jgi:hypothetical protein
MEQSRVIVKVPAHLFMPVRYYRYWRDGKGPVYGDKAEAAQLPEEQCATVLRHLNQVAVDNAARIVMHDPALRFRRPRNGGE